MRGKKMKNPLKKRFLRELKSQWKKYLSLFLILMLTIGFVSGLFVANDSMETAARESYEKYNIEDGHFTLKNEADEELLTALEGTGIHIVKQFFKDFDEDCDLDGNRDAGIRLFVMRAELNRACLMEGRFPEAENELVIDRMHADNQGIEVGDTISLNGRNMIVTGLVAFSDYSTLYENSSDIMFDALTFDVGAVTREAYDGLEGKESYQYAFQYNDRPSTEAEQKDLAEDLAVKIAILSATAGLIDNEDDADRLEEIGDRAEEIGNRADELEEAGDELQAEADALEEEGKFLEEEAAELEAEGEALAEDAQRTLVKVMPLLAAAGIDLSAETITENLDVSLPEAVLGFLPEDIRKEIMDFQKRRDDLEERAEDLQNRADDLQARGDDLQARADELTKEGDDLQAEADALEAELKALIPTIDGFDDLEDLEDRANELTDFVPEFLNQAIHFAPNDLGSDKAMSEVLLIVLVLVIAFIFAITVNNTITTESAVIGTLRASGYTRGEMLVHYISLPMILSLIAAIIGNILGYTCFKNVVVNMYYNSYSLPTYVTLWNADAFIKTTVYPLVLMAVVCVLIVSLKLRISPLRFLRHDLSLSKRKKALKLPKWKFMTRFKMRILIHNIPDYLVLFGGIFFVSVMLAFAVGLPATLNKYENDITDYMLCDYEYILKDYKDKDGNIIETAEPTAEKVLAGGLVTVDGVHPGEEITLYGFAENSRYFDIPYDEKEGVYISVAYSEKFGIKAGDTITLREKYGSGEYVFNVSGIYDLPGTLGVFIPSDRYSEIFGCKEGEFSGFLSENPITDIDEDLVMNVVTEDDMLKVTNQLNHSLGSYAKYFAVICMIIAMLLMYILTKLIIEKNAVSISMVKVLGYTNSEIGKLYVRLTTVVVVIFSRIATYLSMFVVYGMWKNIMYRMSGWFTFYTGWDCAIKIVIMDIVSYLVVALIDMRRIKKVPLTEALKNVE